MATIAMPFAVVPNHPGVDMRYLKNAGLAVLVLAASASTAAAQAKGKWEFGADFAGFQSTSVDGGGSASTIAILGASSVRVGKMITDKISIEPMVTFVNSGPSGSKFTGTSFSVAALWHLKPMAADAPGWFVRPESGMTSEKFSGSTSESPYIRFA